MDLVLVNSLQATVRTGLLYKKMIENFKMGLDINQNAADLNEMRHHVTTSEVIDDIDFEARWQN